MSPTIESLAIPAWAIAAPSAFMALITLRGHRRGSAGCCSGCGYKLLALPPAPNSTTITCPECGTPHRTTPGATGRL